jgi:hypothetical protein
LRMDHLLCLFYHTSALPGHVLVFIFASVIKTIIKASCLKGQEAFPCGATLLCSDSGTSQRVQLAAIPRVSNASPAERPNNSAYSSQVHSVSTLAPALTLARLS